MDMVNRNFDTRRAFLAGVILLAVALLGAIGMLALILAPLGLVGVIVPVIMALMTGLLLVVAAGKLRGAARGPDPAMVVPAAIAIVGSLVVGGLQAWILVTRYSALHVLPAGLLLVLALLVVVGSLVVAILLIARRPRA